MKNTFGGNVTVTLFGESHGPAVGAVLDGMAPGIPVDSGFIAHRLELRKAKGDISTSRSEEDDFEILSGVFNGKTTGTPIWKKGKFARAPGSHRNTTADSVASAV